MWSGVFPAVTTKFTADDRLDHAEMERCFGLMMEAGCDGLIVAGSLGEGPMLSDEEKIDVLRIAQSVARGRPVLLTINEAATRNGAALAKKKVTLQHRVCVAALSTPALNANPVAARSTPEIA